MARWILMRHAHAEPSGDDIDRALAARGREEAHVMGRWLKETGWMPELFVLSPAVRARQTGELVAHAAGLDPEVQIVQHLYPGSGAGYLEALRQTTAPTTLLVGHIPGIEDAVRQLAPDAPAPGGRLMSTGAAACFDDGRLVHLQRPDALEQPRHR